MEHEMNIITELDTLDKNEYTEQTVEVTLTSAKGNIQSDQNIQYCSFTFIRGIIC